MFSGFQIVLIILMLVSFLLEADATIGCLCVEDKPVNPFKKINDIEEDKKQFSHLSGVYSLVIESLLFLLLASSFPDILTDKDESEDVYCDISGEGNDIVWNDNHHCIVM